MKIKLYIYLYLNIFFCSLLKLFKIRLFSPITKKNYFIKSSVLSSILYDSRVYFLNLKIIKPSTININKFFSIKIICISYIALYICVINLYKYEVFFIFSIRRRLAYIVFTRFISNLNSDSKNTQNLNLPHVECFLCQPVIIFLCQILFFTSSYARMIALTVITN